jgi:hypothetical protein
VRWSGWVALGASALGISGCYYGYSQVVLGSPYSMSSRPHPSYFCYDCHGYRYFDPYYDWCANFGFRYAWTAHPQVVRIYRERYVRIREQHPEYGRYRYQPGYRSLPHYREERDYDRWRSGGPDSPRPREYEHRSRKPAPEEKEQPERRREHRKRRDPTERRSERGGWGT